MNILALDLNTLQSPSFIGTANSNIKHLGTWLKLASYLITTEGAGYDRILDGARWNDKEWLIHAGIERGMILNAENESVCPDLWRRCRSHIEVYHIEDTDDEGNVMAGFYSFGSYELRRKRADEVLKSASLRKAVLAKTGGVCMHCGSGYDICVDHIIPVKLGGCNSLDNLQPLCRSCNSKKGAKIEYETTIGEIRRASEKDMEHPECLTP